MLNGLITSAVIYSYYTVVSIFSVISGGYRHLVDSLIDFLSHIYSHTHTCVGHVHVVEAPESRLPQPEPGCDLPGAGAHEGAVPDISAHGPEPGEDAPGQR